MPVHDWTRVEPGMFHTLRQDFGVELKRTLNRGLLPPDLSATTPLPTTSAPNEPEATTYARKANRVHVVRESGELVAVIEIVSPGNSESRNGIREFTTKAVDYLRRGVNLLVIDLFPPTPRDPLGLHRLIWDELSTVPLDPLPPEQPLAVAAFNARDGLTAYVEPLAVSDPLPDAPLFLTAGWYVNVPLERTYSASWAELPAIIRDQVQPPDG